MIQSTRRFAGVVLSPIAILAATTLASAQNSSSTPPPPSAGHPSKAAQTTSGACINGLIGDTTLAGGWGAFETASGMTMEVLNSGVSDFVDITQIGTSLGPLLLSTAHNKRTIGSGWGTWSHGYTGEVFWNNGALSVTYTMPAGCMAFDAYVEPNPFAVHTFDALGTCSDGSTVNLNFTADGSSGANHFGFWTEPGNTLVKIDVTSTADWAIGEWRVSDGDGGGAGCGCPSTGSACTDILVYDHNTQHNLGQLAALNISPGGTVVADSTSFDALLTGGSWDVVVVDVPSNIPAAGWGALEAYVNGGGKCVMGYWAWNSQPGLQAAFGVTVTNSISLVGQTLQDSGAIAGLYTGVTMPNSDWHNHWGDDGDEFNPGAGTGLAHIGNPATPVVVLGNGGNTIASHVIDEAGDTWLADGSGVQIWENYINLVCGGGGGSGEIGDCYCSVNPNSTGGSALICASGSESIAANDLTLTASPVPNQPFIFFTASSQIEVPFGNGFLCAGGGIVRLLPPGVASGNVAQRVVNVPVEIGVPGTRNIQCWFRDPAAGGANFNTSNAVSITFVP